MTYIRAWMSLKFGQIRPLTTELAALKLPFFLALYNDSQVSIVALWATCYVRGFASYDTSIPLLPKSNISSL